MSEKGLGQVEWAFIVSFIAIVVVAIAVVAFGKYEPSYEHEMITVEGIPCIVIWRPLSSEFGISCDWSKYDG